MDEALRSSAVLAAFTAEDAPDHKPVIIAPQPGGGLTHARASLRSPYGQIVSAWQLTDADFRLDVTAPPNTRATIRIPAQTLAQVTEPTTVTSPGSFRQTCYTHLRPSRRGRSYPYRSPNRQ